MLIAALLMLGLLLGAAIAQGEGMLLGAALGALVGAAIAHARRLRALEAERAAGSEELSSLRQALQRMEREQASLTARLAELAAGEARTAAASEPAPRETPPAERKGEAEAGALKPLAAPPSPAGAAEPVEGRPADAPPAATPGPSWPARARDGARELLFGGNTVVRVGILVLLVGVTLLLKWAADHALFPIEARMASAALLALALTAVGLQQRTARPGFARTLQGGGVAALYLVVFFSFRTYGLLPAALAFALLAAIAATSAALALLQDALALVLIGQVGGFLAPILASTGTGSHVALFSYYLLLNAGIFAVAWFRAWRALNVIGFAFTFVIGVAWGVTRYQPEHFATTEPFLVAFLLLYVAIPVLYALRSKTSGRTGGLVDGSLVFGTPLAFLALQLALVREIPFAMAYTSLALAALYLALARLLHRRAPQALRAMVESFLALGVGFGTMAVPYGLDNAGLTGATWAVEGAGLYFLGVRQSRLLSRLAGAGLQGLAGVALVVHFLDSHAGELPVFNTRTLGALLLSASSFFIAGYAHRHRARIPRWEALGVLLLVAWGLLFAVPAGLTQIDAHVPRELQAAAAVGFVGALGLVLELLGARFGFTPLRYPPALLVLLWPVIALAISHRRPLTADGGWLGWSIYAAAVLLCLRRLPAAAPPWVRYLHPVALWSAVCFLALEGYQRTLYSADLTLDWARAALGLAPIVALGGLTRLRHAANWPLAAAREPYFGLGAGVLALGILLWSLASNLGARGLSAPLPYLPILNPVDLSQLLGFAAIASWYAAYRREGAAASTSAFGLVPALLFGLVFLWWNAMLARSVHQFSGVPFTRYALSRSVPLQVALSISWSVIGLAVTALASRRGRRGAWMVGAALLGVVVVKLFTIDLARLSTVAKIGTFLVVGLLLLLVGYLAPVPPSGAARDRQEVAS